MQIVMEDSEYSYVASTKTITFASPYNALSIGQIIRIANLTTGSVFYESKTQKYPISISGADITHTYDDDNDADADKLQIIVDIGSVTTQRLMLHKELRVTTTAQQVSITPSSGKRIRVYAAQCSMLVGAALTATLRGTLAFGTGNTTDADKIIASCRIMKGDDAATVFMSGFTIEGEIDESVTLTNITFSGGDAVTRSVVFYTEEN